MKAHGFRIYRSTNQSFVSGVTTTISFDTKEWDSDGFWNSGTPTIITIPAGLQGFYALTGMIQYASSAVGDRYASIFLNASAELANGGGWASGAAGFPCAEVSTEIYLNSGDQLTLTGLQSSGGALNAVATARKAPLFCGFRVGD